MYKLILRELQMIILLKTFKFLVIPTGKTTDHMALQFFAETILLLKVDHFDGILNRIKLM